MEKNSLKQHNIMNIMRSYNSFHFLQLTSLNTIEIK